MVVVVVCLKEERAKMSRSFPLSVVCLVGWVVAAQRRGGGGRLYLKERSAGGSTQKASE